MKRTLKLYALFFALLSLIQIQAYAQSDETPDADKVLALAKSGNTIDLSKVSFLQKIPMPSGLRDFLNKIVIVKPQTVNENAQNYGLILGGTTKLETITGGVVISGISVEVKIRIFEGSQGKKISVLVGLPSGFKLASLDSKLGMLSSLPFTKLAIAYAADRYVEAEWGLQMDPGVNFLAEVQATGDIGNLLKRLGQNADRLRLSGTITPTITGSKFAVGLGGGVTLGQGGQIGHASGLQLVVYVLDLGVAVAVQGTINFKVPGQDNPIALTGEFKYTPPSLLSVAAFMPQGSFYGPPAFGIKGLALGEFGLQAGVDLAEVAATSGLVPFQELGMAGTVMLGTRKLSLGGKINFGVNPDILLIGELDNLYLQDVLSFGADVLDKIAGRPLNIAALTNNKLPPIGIKTLKVYIVPRDTVFLGTAYQKGIEFDVVTEIMHTDAALAVRMDENGIRGQGFLKGLHIGPVKVTSGLHPKPNTPPDQASLLMSIDPKKLSANLYIDGGIEVDVLDGIKGDTTIDIGTDGISADVAANVFNDFSAEVKISGKGSLSQAAAKVGQDKGDLSKDSNFGVYANFQQTALKKLGAIILQSAKEFDDYRKDVESIKSQNAKLQAQIDKNNIAIAAKSADDKKTLRDAQAKLNDLGKDVANLKNAVAKCEGNNGQSQVPNQCKTLHDNIYNARPNAHAKDVQYAKDNSYAGVVFFDTNKVYIEDGNKNPSFYSVQTTSRNVTEWDAKPMGCLDKEPRLPNIGGINLSGLFSLVYYPEYGQARMGPYTISKPTGKKCYYFIGKKEVRDCYAPPKRSFWDKAWGEVKSLGSQGLACADVAVKGTELGAKEAAYKIASGALDAAIALNKLDPDIAKLEAANVSMKAAMKSIDASSAVGKFGVEAISQMGQVVGKILTSGFDLSQVEVDGNIADLKAMKLPMFHLQGTVAGKHFNIKFQANIKDVKSFAKSVFESLRNSI